MQFIRNGNCLAPPPAIQYSTAMSRDLLANHRVLLNDTVRMAAYEKAIRAAVRPGMTVADIGAGLGVLAQMAVKAGAQKVYAIEFDADTIALAREQFAADQKTATAVVWMQGLSGQLRLPEKVDVIVSETLGSLALDENTLPTLIDARRRFLKPGGVMIPQRLTLFIAPAAAPSRKKVQPLSSVALLAAPVEQRVDFTTATDPGFSLEADFEITQNGTLTGFAGWFEVTLSRGVSFSTAPDAPATHWQQGVLPLRKPEKVQRGQQIHFHLTMAPDQLPTGVETVIEYDFSVTSC